VSKEPEGFNAFLLEAFEEVSEQVNEWQAVADSLQNTIDHFEEQLSSISGTIEDAAWQIDGDLAEVDHMRVEQSIDEIESAIERTGSMLIRLAIVRELGEAASTSSSLACGSEDISGAIRSAQPFVPVKIEILGHDEDEEPSDELIEAVENACNEAADMVRATAREVSDAWEAACDAAGETDLAALLERIGVLDIAVRRLRSAYDEWYAYLGGLSNISPSSVGGVDGAAVADFIAWAHLQSD
jgi:hypothetical protein